MVEVVPSASASASASLYRSPHASHTHSYGSLQTSSLGPLPVRYLSKKAAFVAFSVCIVTLLCLVAAVVTIDDYDSVELLENQSKLRIALSRKSILAADASQPQGNVAQAMADAKIAIAAAGPVSNPANSIDAAVSEAKKDAQIAIAAAGPIEPAIDADVFVKEAQKQAKIAEDIAKQMDPKTVAAPGQAAIDSDLKDAQNELAIAMKAAGPDPKTANVDYNAIAQKEEAIAKKDEPDGGMGDASFAKKEAEIAIRDAGGAGGLEEAKAQAAIAIAAANGENDFVSAARKAADNAMAQAEMQGKEPDWAEQAKQQLKIAVDAAVSMGLTNVKVPADLTAGGGAAAAASSASSASK